MSDISMRSTSLGSAEPDSSGRPPGITVGAFGKHPAGGRDFFGVGIEGSPRLNEAASILYEEGINRNIESGAWGNPTREPEKILAGLDHCFVWTRGLSDVVLGQWWPSTDEHGRGRPMMVFAHVTGMPFPGVVSNVLAGLGDLRGVLHAAAQVDEIRGLVEEASAMLRSSRVRDAIAAVPPMGPEMVMSALRSRPEMGPDEAGLAQVLFSMVKVFRGHIPQEQVSFWQKAKLTMKGMMDKDGDGKADAAHLRVPPCAASRAEALTVWSSFLAILFPPGTDLIAVSPADGSHVDLVVGRPAAREQLRFLPARGIPDATSMDWNIPVQFSQVLRSALASRNYDMLLAKLERTCS